jgi:hypothetical protein
MQPKKSKLPPQFLKTIKSRQAPKRITPVMAKQIAGKLNKKAPAMDAEDKKDGGVDEALEKS